MLLALPFPARAQQPKKVPLIGYVSPFDPVRESARSEAIRQRLRELGYIEGQNIATEYRYAEGKSGRAAELAVELVRLKVDVILVSGDGPVLAAKKATKTIPIVMMGAGSDPVEEGIIESLARPGGNVTGITNLYRELGGKRLELLKDAVPKLARVGLLRGPGDSINSVIQLKELRPAAVALKLKLEEIETQIDAKGLESAFRSAKQKQVGAIMTTTGRTFFAERKRIVDLAVKYRLPAIYFQKEFVDEGGLMSYGVDFDDLYQRAVVYVEKILKGAKPADLPVQQAMKFEFIINLKAAKQIGYTIPYELLARANQVIK